MVDEVLHPGGVGPAFCGIEGRLGEDVVGAEVGMEVAPESVGVLGAEVGLDAAPRASATHLTRLNHPSSARSAHRSQLGKA